VRKVAVVTSASGSGGTTLARRIATRLRLPLYELDALFWKPGWEESTAEELRTRVEPIVAIETLVIDGSTRASSGNSSSNHRGRRRRYPARFASYAVVRLRSEDEADRFLSAIDGRET
jgi:hypothetical protein